MLLLWLTGFLYAASQLIVDILYDDRYAGAGAMMQILAVSIFAGRFGVAQQIYLALGITRHLAVINIAMMVAVYTLVPALYVTNGIDGAIWGIALYSIVQIPITFYFNHTLSLNDFRKESIVLLALPVGYFCGSAFNHLWPWK